ncbi:MAG TPA: NUDIX domain-containing protein [Candidatus Woesebacteria bacterium]|nr:NUDIX domain-containing protein [Candidatus Woesebacteria bacterium]HNS65854.1 NUDIX domain-containing protein [Candidatus Woesebacteria bacterium]
MSQPHRLTDQVKILHKVAIVSNNQVLLLKRHGAAHSRPGKWDLPGGNAEWPDNPAKPLLQKLHRTDVVREVNEETGITISESLIVSPIFFDTFFETEKQMYTVVVGWLVKLDRHEEIVLSREHTEFRWAKQADIQNYDFGFAGGKDGFLVQIIEEAFTLIGT